MRAQRWVNIAAFLKFALAVTTTTMFAILGLYIIIYSPAVPVIVSVLVGWMPFFHYGKLMMSITTTVYLGGIGGGGSGGGGGDGGSTGLHRLAPGVGGDLQVPPRAAASDVGAGTAASGPSYFGWSQLTQRPAPVTLQVNGLPTTWQDVAPATNLWLMAVVTVAYLAVAWYLSQATSTDLGAAQPWYFPLSPYYWGTMKRAATAEVGDTIAHLQRLSATEGSIRIHKVSKTFAKTTALKEVSLAIPPSTLIAVLGQNGAGKTTLCHILAGLLAPTHGEVFMSGLVRGFCYFTVAPAALTVPRHCPTHLPHTPAVHPQRRGAHPRERRHLPAG